MRSGKRLAALLMVMGLLFTSSVIPKNAAFADAAATAQAPLSGDVFALPGARLLRTVPAFDILASGEGLTLTPASELPEDAVLLLAGMNSEPVGFTQEGFSVSVPRPPEVCWLTAQWTDGVFTVLARYLVSADGRCDFWTASADDRQRVITRRGFSGGYTVEIEIPNVHTATVYYDADGVLHSSVLLGDEREEDTLPMILQYDEFGRAASITAADLQHTYTYSRAQGAWVDEAGSPADSPQLPPFAPERHPAPAALPLEIPTVRLTEAAAGIRRDELTSSAPELKDPSAEEGVLQFYSDADEAEAVTADGLSFSTVYGTLSHEGTRFYAGIADLAPELRIQYTLVRGSVTAVYQASALQSVSDSTRGVTLLADGTLHLTRGACLARYNAKGNLTEVRVQSADGAVLTYNRQGRLTGWEMDGYIWTRENGWRGTAVNENGNIIHPAVKQPAAVNLDSYPPITIEE